MSHENETESRYYTPSYFSEIHAVAVEQVPRAKATVTRELTQLETELELSGDDIANIVAAQFIGVGFVLCELAARLDTSITDLTTAVQEMYTGRLMVGYELARETSDPLDPEHS